MNHSAEFASTSVHSTTPRFQQPRITVSTPPENAAAGDATRIQISSDNELNLNLSSSAEIITMDTSRSSLSELWNLLNDSMDRIVSTTDKNISLNNCEPRSRVVDFNDEESRFKARQSLKRSKDNDRSDLENKKTLKNCSTNERTTVEKILSPDRKVSMFSAEIWTEKVLPSNTIVYPEPELVEIYFDKNTTSDRFDRFGGYSTESIEVPSIWTRSDRGVLGITNLVSPPLSARKSRTSSSGQKTINFDDEIWPVCPMLIPSERELSQSNLVNKYDFISPEKLNENSEETIAITHLRSESPSKKNSSILGISSRSGSNQNELKNNFEDRKVIEPTHEIEYQNTCKDSPEKLEKCYNLEKISREIKSVTSTACRVLNNDLEEKDLETESLAGITYHKFGDERRKKLAEKFAIDYEPCQSRLSKSNLLSVSNSEPVNAVLEDIPNEEQKLSDVIFNESSTCPVTKQISFGSTKNRDVDRGVSKEETTSRDVDDTSQSSIMNSKSVALGSKNEFEPSEDCMNPPDSTSDSEFRFIESNNLEEEVIERKIKKNRKSVKVVRFKTCDKNGDTQIDGTIRKEAKNFETNYIRKDRSKIQFILDDRNEIPDFVSVESFQEEVDQLENKIARRIEFDPVLDDALETLTKVERIVEGNCQMEERLQQLQPNVTIPWTTPSDAGKLLAKALMRCRNYMLNNGYSRGATITMNKLLTSKVQNLKQLVERQRLMLTTQEKRRSAPSGRRQSTRSHHDNFLNSKGALIMNEMGTNQVKLLIADILMSTEKLLHKLTVNKSQKKCPVNGSKNSIKNNRTSSDSVHSKTNKINSSKEFNLRSEIRGSKGSVREDELIVSRCRHEELVGEFDNPYSFVPPATYMKKISPNEPTKTLKKLFNDLWENRSKTLPRHYNVNDSTTNNFRSLASSHNNSISQKLPVWKPAGNNVVQSSVNIVPNNQKIRSPPSSSANKRKNSTNEQTRETKSQQRTKVTPTTVKDPSKVVEKSSMKAHDTISLAKVQKDQMKEHRSEVTSVDKRKVQVLNEVVETKARKPRSKSRTRTRSSIKIPRITVTEIPLKHAKEYSPTIEQKVAVTEEVPSSKKPCLYPKGIIQMLEDLIRSSSHETSIRNASSVQIIARCNTAAKEDVSNFLPLKSKVRAITETELHSSNDQDDYGTEVLSENKSDQLKLAKEITVSETTAEVIDDITDPYNLRKDFDLIVSSEENAARILTTSRSNSEVNGNQIREKLNTFSMPNAECTAELSSEHSIGCISSKYCQASLTSVTSHEISEEIISNQVSETAVSSDYCERTSKESNESFDTVEDEEVTRDECVQRFERDEIVSTENGVTPKKKFVDRHAKSLEMLKEILSDQGLGIHFLSRAESEIKDKRCKCSSSKKGSTARKSSGVNCCGEIVSKPSFPDRILSSTLFSKLATLSESESDIEQVEVSTMTSENGSAENINDHKMSNEFESHCNKRDKKLLNGVVTIENATQFDISLKSDVCVGDELVSETLLPLNKKKEHILAHNSEVLYTLPDAFYPMSFDHEEKVIGGNETFEYKLPEEILEAFRLAAIRANNLYIAFRILKEGMPSGVIRDSKKNFTDSSTSRSESVADQYLFDGNSIKPVHVQSLGETFSSCRDKKLLKQSDSSKSDSPLKIIIPRIRKNVDNDREEFYIKKSQVRSIETSDKISVKESQEKFSHLDKVNPLKPQVRSKRFEINRKLSIVNIDEKTDLKERNVGSNNMTPSDNKLGCTTGTPRSIATVQIKGDRLQSQHQENLINRSGHEKLIKMLHFAGKKFPSVIGKTSGIIDVAMNSQSSNTNSFDHGSSKTTTKIQESLPGSPIKTLLEENLQRFKIDYNPIDDDLILKDFRDHRFAESTDDEAVINEGFIETATSTSRTHLADCNILSEVESVLNFLLNDVTENWRSSTMTDYRATCSHLPRHRRRVRKPIRRTKTDRERKIIEYGNRSLLCGKYFNFLSCLIVSRKHLLSLIYAAVCSFVFFCLQFSIHCEI